MPEQRFNLDSNDELTTPVEPDVDASALPVSVFDQSSNFGFDEVIADESLDNFGTKQSESETGKTEETASTKHHEARSTPTVTPVEKTPQTPTAPLPERIAHLVAAGPPMPVLFAPPAPAKEPVLVEEDEEETLPAEKEEVLVEEELIIAPPVKKVEEPEPRPPLIQNVGLPRYILLSTTVMTVASLVPLFLPL